MDAEARAREAAALKDNAFLAEVLSSIEAAAVSAWVGTPAVGGEQAREQAWMLHKTVGRIRAELQAAIDEQRISASRLTAPLR
jgi:hypothetical protein